MSFIKQKFIKNTCCVCKKTFCCPKCRLNHEVDYHQIFPDCEICIYGKIYISTATEEVLIHIKQTHWPLHCLDCKRLFGSMNELAEHNKCPMANVETPISKTPNRLPPLVNVECTEEPDFNSPPVGILIPNLPDFAQTSTPMQHGEKVFSDNFPDNITPVDNYIYNKIQNANGTLSAQTPHNSLDQKKNDNKRRVTFSETPQPEHYKKKCDGLLSLKGSLKRPTQLCLQDVSISEEADIEKSENYYSSEAKNCETKENISNEAKDIPVKRRRSSVAGDTLWETAINESIEIHLENEIDSPVVNSSHDIPKINNDSVEAIKNEVKNETFSPTASVENYSLDIPKENSVEVNKRYPGQISNLSDSHFSYIDNSSLSKRSHVYSDISCSSEKSASPGIWSSVAFIMKSVVGFSKNAVNAKANKRHLSDSEPTQMELEKLKRIKLTDIKCRPTIRNIKNYKFITKFIKKVDKATQTDETLL